MKNSSRHGVIEEVAIMIRTGASEKTVSDYVENLLIKGDITARVYEILIDMIVTNY